MLIVDGNPNAGIEQERLEDPDIYHRMKTLLTIEHLRRIGFLRARYPRDPFNTNLDLAIPETAWWTGHPFVKVIYGLPPEHRDNVLDLLVRTGDLRMMGAQMASLSETEQEDFVEKVELIDKHLPELLEYLEDKYGDSQKLAWSEPMSEPMHGTE